MKYQSLLDLNKDKLKKIGVSLNNYKEDLQSKSKRQLIREIQDYLETVDDDLEIKREVVINILLIYEEINANVDKLDSTNQPTVAHGNT